MAAFKRAVRRYGLNGALAIERFEPLERSRSGCVALNPSLLFTFSTNSVCRLRSLPTKFDRSQSLIFNFRRVGLNGAVAIERLERLEPTDEESLIDIRNAGLSA